MSQTKPSVQSASIPVKANATVEPDRFPQVSVRSQVGAGCSLNPVHAPCQLSLFGSQSSTMNEPAKANLMWNVIDRMNVRVKNERQALGSMVAVSEREQALMVVSLSRV